MSVQQSITGIEVYGGRVLPEWIDVNQHMNVAYYVLAFDLGVDALWSRFGITDSRIAKTQGSTFAVEAHVTYQAELKLGDEFLVTSEILAFDAKRIHQFQRMYRVSDEVQVATCEWMNLFVDLSVRKVATWPADILARIRAVAESQRDSDWPQEAGRRMAVRAPNYTKHHEYPGSRP